MIRKIAGWIFVVLSVISLFALILNAIYGLNEQNDVEMELVLNGFHSMTVSFFVCTGFAILFLRKKVNSNAAKTGRTIWYRIRRFLGYLFLIMFMYSLPGLRYFDIYELLPRVLFLALAYFLLKSYSK